MIIKLTKKQESFLVEYRNEILAYGRSTEPSDRKATEKSITFFYKKIGYKKPMFFWFDGPLSGGYAIEIIKNIAKPESNPNLWSNLGSNLESNLGSNLESNLWSNLRSNLGSNLRLNLESNLESNLWSNLWSNLRSNLESNLRSNLESNLFYGQHDLYWAAFYDFCSKIGIEYKKEEVEILSHWLSIGKSTGWWSPYENVCFCFERHSVLKVDGEGKLHCDDGPAMSFRDGHSLFFYHGREIKNIDMSIGNLGEQIKTSIIFSKD